ncbi:MAG TPA: BamA/TamA family outer membrane protein [Longimicrobiales bacterium]|nr:BamA/TamA family outer membrane protein [Longimicrobiales bacterium]
MKRFILPIAALLSITSIADAQTVRAAPSTEFDRQGLWRALFGKGWRDIWSTPIEAPILDLASYAGGIEAFKEGGNQTHTLHFHGKDGHRYVFRTTYKNVDNALPSDLKKTLIGDVIQDQTGSFHPTGLLAVDVLEDAVGLIHAPRTLYYMQSDERLGKYAKRVEKQFGTMEEKPEEIKGGGTIGGAKDIRSTDDLMIKLEADSKNKIDARDYLTARFIDFIVGDPDRGADNWDWAQFDRGDFNMYRPIPRDRDYAFMHIEGFLPNLAAMGYPKLTQFRNEFPKLRTLVFMTSDFDRSHLSELTWSQWQDVIKKVQNSLNDATIEKALARIPPEHRKLSEDIIRGGLRGRRAALPDIAAQFYRLVAEDAEVFASDEDERAEVDYRDDGSMDVTVYRKNMIVFQRRFLPAETQEVRLHMERGDDRVVVRGGIEQGIQLRVLGGEGDDVLVDSTRMDVRFYDASGKNQFVTGPRTVVHTAPYEFMQPARFLDAEDNEKKPDENPRKIREERRGRHQDLQNARADFVAQKTTAAIPRTWGKKSTWMPLFEYHDGPGVVLGFGPVTTDFGFRRLPYESLISVKGMKGIGGGYGVQLNADKHFESSPIGVSALVRASTFGSNRFFGFGNDSPLLEEDASLVMRDEIIVAPAVDYWFNRKTRISVGPKLHYTDPDAPSEFGFDKRTDVGVRADYVALNAVRTQTGVRGADLMTGASASGDFREVHALGKLFVPISRATIALRAGGKRVWGDFPLHEAAFIGGIESLRGVWWNRYAGDTALHGSVELRVPLMRVELLTRGDLGIIAFTDAGRVWYNGASVGDWHVGKGAGLWFGSLSQAFSVTYARAEQGRVNLSLGFPF